MSVYSANHKPLPEYDVDPADIDQVVELAKAKLGVRVDKARNMRRWLRFVHGLDPDLEAQVSENSRTAYRKILGQLANGNGPTSPTPLEKGGTGKPPRINGLMSTDRAAA